MTFPPGACTPLSYSAQAACSTVEERRKSLRERRFLERSEAIRRSAIGLAQFECDALQGYLFARPLPFNEFVAWHRNAVTP